MIMEKVRFIGLKDQVPAESRYLEYAKIAFSVFGSPFNLAWRFILSQPQSMGIRENPRIASFDPYRLVPSSPPPRVSS